MEKNSYDLTSFHWEVLAKRSFEPHLLHYFQKHNGKSREMQGLQRNGQLMGSPLSFPILCLMNLSTFLVTRKRWEQRQGIDALEFYRLHEQTAGEVGLKFSRGKSYVHPRYVNINSTCFDVTPRTTKVNGDRATVSTIDYLNVALCLGKHKVQNKEDASESISHWNRVFSGLRPGPIGPNRRYHRGRAVYQVYGLGRQHEQFFFDVFKEHHSGPLATLSLGQLSYHAPIHLGGLGLQRSEFSMTGVQHAYARLLLGEMGEGLQLSCRPTRSKELSSEPAESYGGAWKVIRIDATTCLDAERISERSSARLRAVRKLLKSNPGLARPLRTDHFLAVALTRRQEVLLPTSRS